jgi:hypothetical protein
VFVPGSDAFRRSLAVTIGVKTEGFWPVEVVLHEQPRSLPIVGAGKFVVDLEELQSTVQPRPYGEMLGRALFTDSVRDLFVRGESGAGPLHLMLSLDAPELRPLQWERLCAPRGGGMEFVGLDQRVAYSRYIPSPVLRTYRELAARELRVLVLVAAPDGLQTYGLSSFDAEAAVAAVRAGLPDVPCTVLGPVAGAVGPASLDALCAALTDGRHTIVHVVAHGRMNPVKRETLLYLSSEGGHVDVVEKHQLIDRLGLLADGLPHLMFFAACDSGVDLGEDNIGGLARGLVGDLGIPAVLAMSSRVSVATAFALTRSFYANLRAHGHVDQALVEAHAELASRRDALVPALYSRLGALPLFSPDRGHAESGPEPEYSRSDMRAWSAALQQALARRDQLSVAGRATHTVDSEISGIRHRMRQDGQLHAGDVLRGRYLLLSLLGEGPSSATWRAHDRADKRDVALKILHPQHTRHAELVRQFRGAADRLRTLDHPNIVRVLGPVEQEHGRVFVAMELLAGSTLRDAVRERRLAPEGVLAVVGYLAAALSYAHGRGLVHRDVEPTNVIFDDEGVPKLTDFDMLIDSGKILDTGISHLTPGIYVAPECQAEQPKASPETDVYGLAVTTLFMLTGSPPFAAFREPRRYFAGLPVAPHVRRALRRAIAFAPRDRFRTIDAFVAALKDPGPAPPWPWIAAAALVLGALAAILALAV